MLFDMDGTLVDTHTYFQNEMTKTTLEVVSKIFPGTKLREQIKITKEIMDIVDRIYEEQEFPILVDTLSQNAFSQYLKDNNVKFDKGYLHKMIKSFYKDFYLTSPPPFSYTISALHKITEFQIPIGVYSHAQEEWTRIKVEKIRDDYFKKYKKDIKIPFFTTAITDLKDKEGWINAGKFHNINPHKTLVVGDNLKADIYAAMDAGYKYLVYLSNSDKQVIIESAENVRLFVAKNLNTVFK